MAAAPTATDGRMPWSGGEPIIHLNDQNHQELTRKRRTLTLRAQFFTLVGRMSNLALVENSRGRKGHSLQARIVLANGQHYYKA